MRAIASEHDDAAGTRRGPAIFAFALGGLRLCHFGDFGQASLRPEQRAAIGDVDVLMLPIGGGPTVGLAACDGEVRRIDGPEAELEGLLGNGVSQVIGLLTPPA